jgi:hypothetical protein
MEPMTEGQARKILENNTARGNYVDDSEFFASNSKTPELRVDGWFRLDYLEALVWWMKNRPGSRVP